jgi:hypothetical protein
VSQTVIVLANDVVATVAPSGWYAIEWMLHVAMASSGTCVKHDLAMTTNRGASMRQRSIFTRVVLEKVLAAVILAAALTTSDSAVLHGMGTYKVPPPPPPPGPGGLSNGSEQGGFLIVVRPPPPPDCPPTCI